VHGVDPSMTQFVSSRLNMPTRTSVYRTFIKAVREGRLNVIIED
jgi:hypothetical protein